MEPNKPTDDALGRRLRGLSALPVDTSRLDRALEAQLPPPPAVQTRRRWLTLPRGLIAAAAVLAVVAGTTLVTLPGGREAYAQPTRLVQMHEDLVSGRSTVTRAATLDEARAAIQAQWANAPAIPTLPIDQAHACCMKPLSNRNVACVLLEIDGVPVTMAVAHAAEMALPKSTPTVIEGRSVHLSQVGRYTMAMTERDGSWVCLVGALPAARLGQIAAEIQF